MLLRRNNSDNIGCAIVALDGEAPRWCATTSSPPGQHRASMIGGSQTSVDEAALFNSVAVRYVDSDGGKATAGQRHDHSVSHLSSRRPPEERRYHTEIRPAAGFQRKGTA
jgi:hypothetical protein